MPSPQNPSQPNTADQELQKQTPILQQIRDAIKTNNQMVLTSIA